jgi:hypothetical protein
MRCQVESAPKKQGRVKDYYGTFLESVKRSSQVEQNVESATDLPMPMGAGMNQAPTSPADPVRIARTLSTAGPISVAELQVQLQIGVFELLDHLRGLKESGLVDLVGSPGLEVVRLTENGKRFAEMS